VRQSSENRAALDKGAEAMTNYTKLQSRCQRGEASLAGANNLLAECHGALGKLMAENERLRKNSERYQWLRDKSEAVHQFYLSVPLWFTGVSFRPEDVDKAIDAMNIGEQP
jgi:hypothetical protein